MINLSSLDREVLNIIQKEFPLTACPYKDIAQKIGVDEEAVLTSINKMKSAGIIRRIGGIFDTPRMGFHSTLCACMVPEEIIAATAAIVNEHKGVTHNYLRDNDVYNLWFTLTASSNRELKETLLDLEQKTGLVITSMPAIKVFKIKVFFEMGE